MEQMGVCRSPAASSRSTTAPSPSKANSIAEPHSAWSCRWRRSSIEEDRRVLPRSPALPQGEGTPHSARRRAEGLRIGESAAGGSPSPRGEGWGEGEETLLKPARLRTADELGYSERRKTKLHTRRSAESLTIAIRLPPHPSPLPQGEGSAYTPLRPGQARRHG